MDGLLLFFGSIGKYAQPLTLAYIFAASLVGLVIGALPGP
jgi:hypothetical protein